MKNMSNHVNTDDATSKNDCHLSKAIASLSDIFPNTFKDDIHEAVSKAFSLVGDGNPEVMVHHAISLLLENQNEDVDDPENKCLCTPELSKDSGINENIASQSNSPQQCTSQNTNTLSAQSELAMNEETSNSTTKPIDNPMDYEKLIQETSIETAHASSLDVKSNSSSSISLFDDRTSSRNSEDIIAESSKEPSIKSKKLISESSDSSVEYLETTETNKVNKTNLEIITKNPEQKTSNHETVDFYLVDKEKQDGCETINPRLEKETPVINNETMASSHIQENNGIMGEETSNTNNTATPNNLDKSKIIEEFFQNASAFELKQIIQRYHPGHNQSHFSDVFQNNDSDCKEEMEVGSLVETFSCANLHEAGNSPLSNDKPGSSGQNHSKTPKTSKKPTVNTSQKNLLTKRSSDDDSSPVKWKKIKKYREQNHSSDENSDSASQKSKADVEMDLLPCDSCGINCRLSKLTQCRASHLICQSCLEEEVKSVMQMDNKMHLSCSLPVCSEVICIDSTVGLLPTLVLCLLKENIAKKEVEATTKAISQLKDLVSCPSCDFQAVQDRDQVFFKCQNKNCDTYCCRYCKAPWKSASKHQHCEGLSFVGTKCLNDVSALPENWIFGATFMSKDEAYFSVPVPLDSRESQVILRSIQSSVVGNSFQIKNLYRIQNKKLWEKYVLTRKHIIKEVGIFNMQEKHLFHGTESKNFELICKEGFDMRVPTSHGKVNGKGIYFSTKFRYSMKYSGNSKQLFISRVLCGFSTRGDAKFTRPPAMDSGRLFDSCVDAVENPTMYVIFDNAQCYPEYIVQY